MAYTPTNAITVYRYDSTSHNYQFRVTVTEGAIAISNTKDVTFTLQYKNDTNNTWWSSSNESYHPKVALYVNGANVEETFLRTTSSSFVATTTWTTIITKTLSLSYQADGTYSGTCGFKTTIGGGTACKSYGPRANDSSTVWAFGTPDKGMSTITISSYPFIIDKTSGSIGVNCFPTGTNTIEIKDSSGQYQINDYNYLINKPTIPSVGNATITIQKNGTSAGTFTTNQSSAKSINITVPTKVSELTNDSNYVTTTTMNTAIANAGHLKRSVVAALPTGDIDDNTIYMVKVTGTTGNVYTEYMYINSAWEQIGDTAPSLTGYVKESQLVALTNAEITTIVDDAYAAVFTS